MKFCPNCGSELKPEAKFCTSCGSPVSTETSNRVEPILLTDYQKHEPVYEQAKEPLSAFKEVFSGKTNLVQRIINILTKPKEEWVIIENEKPEVMKLIGGYALILALIPALAIFFYYAIIGESVYGFTTRSFSLGVQKGIAQLIVAGLGAYLLAWVIDQLASSFESERNFGRSLQLAVYASTPQWIAGILFLFSTSMSLVVLLLGLYSIYLFAIGLPILKKTPKDKVVGYVALTIISMVAISLVLGMILSAVFVLLF